MSGRVGEPLENLDTPALLVDLDAVERNVRKISSFVKECGIAWRPHMKGIKVPAVAHYALTHGAIGVTCAKVSEAEIMAAAGISDILIANEIVGTQKVLRVAGLARRSRIIVCVDSWANAIDLSAVAHNWNTQIGTLVEVNIGLDRCGVEPSAAAQFASEVCSLPGLKFLGVMGWEGHLAGEPPSTQKKSACEQAVGRLVEAAEECRARGLQVDIVSCGGTGTYMYSAAVPGVTEVQAGGGILGDVAYRDWGAGAECALTVLTTVISRPTATRVVVDAGRKSMQREVAVPEVRSLSVSGQVRMSAEHSDFNLTHPNHSPAVGEKIQFTVGYGDTTVCLHDELVGYRGNRVEVIWPILGRGKLQ